VTKLGERLRLAREVTDQSQTDIAAAVGVKYQQVQLWEKDVIPPDKHRLRLADALRIEIAALNAWIADEWKARDAAGRQEREALRELVEHQRCLLDEQVRLLAHQADRMDDILRQFEESIRDARTLSAD